MSTHGDPRRLNRPQLGGGNLALSIIALVIAATFWRVRIVPASELPPRAEAPINRAP